MADLGFLFVSGDGYFFSIFFGFFRKYLQVRMRVWAQKLGCRCMRRTLWKCVRCVCGCEQNSAHTKGLDWYRISVLGRLGSRASTEKKVLGRLWVTFEGCFFMFSGAKKMSNFFQKYCSVRTKKLHKMKVKKMYFFLGNLIMNLNRLQKNIQLCLALLEIAHRETYV